MIMKCLVIVIVVTVAAFTTISADSSVVTDRLKVSIYYESFCPDSRDFITEQLHPYFCKVKEYLDLNFVPFGKANSTDQCFTCQHGPKECLGNTIHNCVLKRIYDSKVQVDYVNCAMCNPNEPGRIDTTCVEQNGIDVEQVKICYTSSEGTQLMLEAEQKTKSVLPGHLEFVPTIVFDDEYNDGDQNEAFTNFQATLCKKLANYEGVCLNGVITNPEIC